MASKRGSKSKNETAEPAETPKVDEAVETSQDDTTATDAKKVAAVEDAEIIEETTGETTGATPDGDETVSDADKDTAVASDDSEEATGDADDSAEPVEVERIEPEPSAPPPVATEPVVVKRSGLSVLLGGAAAAVLGFIVAQAVPNGWPVTPDPAVTDALSAADEALSAETDNLTARVADLESSDMSDALAPLQDQIAALDDKVSSEFAALTDRVSALEERPIVDLSTLDNSAAVEAELEKLRAEIAEASAAAQSQIDAARNEANLLEQNALEAAQAAARRAALSRVLAALDSGAPYADTLDEFSDLAGVEVPEGLTAGAADGVPTLAALQADFPPLAREALTAMRRADDGGENTLSNFFQTQFGVRSLEPQEGDSPNAILSRIEAATTEGRLGDALTQAEALPEVGATILAPWIEAAQLRVDAFAAADALTQSVTTN
ncbi:COG4223 family protein [Shimia ponticola]|uniref:COG4223 family protein n=1 Tax=Shimia ponticola TaxID=2582893 RepID=UPI0011BE8F3A|nr:hypothetical protein [Shimia ponticola]